MASLDAVNVTVGSVAAEIDSFSFSQSFSFSPELDNEKENEKENDMAKTNSFYLRPNSRRTRENAKAPDEAGAL
jgi:hypothetical protein